jgi:hypothetical protein
VVNASQSLHSEAYAARGGHDVNTWGDSFSSLSVGRRTPSPRGRSRRPSVCVPAAGESELVGELLEQGRLYFTPDGEPFIPFELADVHPRLDVRSSGARDGGSDHGRRRRGPSSALDGDVQVHP